MKNKILRISTLVLIFSPVFAFAYFEAISDMLDNVIDIMDQVRYLVGALCFIYFFWGLGQFIRSAGEPKAREEGRQRMIWGVIAIAVLLSIYGIVVFLRNAFGITTNGQISIPVV